MAKSKKPLKAALHSQQSRLKEKQRAAQAAQTAELMARKQGGGGPKRKPPTTTATPSAAKGKGKEVIPPHRPPTIPFRATDRILLIGEGNFSFARALIRSPPVVELAHMPAKNVTATAYDAEDACYEKYPEAAEIVQDLRAAGVEVLFGVDATQLGRVPALKGRKWDRIVWNFPHAGKGITDQDRNILSNQLLILGFLRSAADFLVVGPLPETFRPKKRKPTGDDEEDEPENPEDTMTSEDSTIRAVASRGTVLITLRNVVPYTQWDVPRLAKNPPPQTGSTAPNPPYTVVRSFAFQRSIWNGYEHRMTKGERAQGKGKTGEGGEDRTWEFCLKN
ncbi:25S rRNA (uridine-N(3))-methyltransferase [Favolaschia claudopus]|uniref:25S rRNA (Uridine-N(3))-methyltransferase n=1 Tax=Favolaschia claudopus TaxID=2862362 RepID=A0AAW0EGV9_9AGAR